MYKRISIIQISIVLTVLAVMGVPMIWAGDLVPVSGTSPFGALEECGNFPGDVGEPGTVYIDSEVEPWIAVNPTDPGKEKGHILNIKYSKSTFNI